MARRSVISGVVAAVIILVLSTAGSALAHCDTIDGPVILQARQALEKEDVKIVLPWVTADKEKEIREAFDLVVAVRGKGPLESGDPRPLLSLINEKVHEGIHKYYTEARERRVHAKESVEAGRAYVQEYVPYLHFVERLYNDAVTPITHGAGEGGHAGPAGHPELHTH